MAIHFRDKTLLAPACSLPIAQLVGCLDCGRASDTPLDGRCVCCQSTNLLAMGELWEQMKVHVIAHGGKARLIIPITKKKEKTL